MTVAGRGQAWTALVTPEGEARLAQVTEDALSGDRLISDGAQLIADVLGSDGVLDVSAIDPGKTDWESRVRNANQSAARPHGKRLKYYNVARGKRELRLEANLWETVSVPSVQVPTRVKQYHSAVQHYIDDSDWHFVTPKHVRRAALLLEAFARACEAEGMEVRQGVPWWTDGRTWQNSRRAASHLAIERSGRTYELVVRELKGTGSTRRDYDAQSDARLPRWQRMQHYTFVATGRLEFELRGPGLWEFSIKDTRSRSAEDQISRLVQALEVGWLAAGELDRQIAERADCRRADWEAAMRAARREWESARRVEILDARAKQWEQHRRILRYIESFDADAPEPADPRWIAWARDWLGVTENHAPLTSFELPEPRAADLQPFLHGWSALGPDAAPVMRPVQPS